MPNSNFGTNVDRIISESFTESLSAERQAEIDIIGKAWDFYYGYQEQYIKKYELEEWPDYNSKEKPTFNYTRAIVDEYVNGVFGKPVTWTFSEEEHQEIWDGIVQPNTFYKVLPFFTKCQRIAEVSKTCVVMIRYNAEESRTYFEDVRGEFVSFLPKAGNPKEIGTLIISYLYDTGSSDPRERILKRVEVWDDLGWEIWIQSPSLGESKLLDSGENPYGFIPAEILRPQEDDNTHYGISNVDDIVSINEIYNNLWTNLIQICAHQSFSTLFLKSESDLELVIGPKKMIKLPNTMEADASYLTPNPKISGVHTVLLELKSELQNIARVPNEVMSSSKGLTPESGYALRIKRIPIEQEWERRRMSYGPSVKSLGEKAIIVDSINRGEDPGGVHCFVDFTNTVPPLAPQEQILTDEQHLRYNLITPIDMMIRRDPSLSREEAKLKIEKNRKENESLGLVQFGEDNQTEFERMKVRMGQKERSVMNAIEGE